MILLRISTGFFLILTFIFVFSASFIGFTYEFQQVQRFESVLEESIKLDDFFLSSNSYMYDANENVISEIYSSKNRIYIPYQEIPTYFIEAIIATEDQHFFSHKGFDMSGIARALFVNAENQEIKQGGSTVTQQLVKNIYLSSERTYNRKLTELLYAYQLEKMFSKEEIIELYLNTIYFQNGVYGVAAASQFYFSLPVDELSLAEIAFLSAVPNNPTLFNPLLQIENTQVRQNWILTKMQEMNFIDQTQYSQAVSEKIKLLLSKKIDFFPDYVTYIHHELEQLIGEKEGFNDLINKSKTVEEKSLYLKLREQKTVELLASGIHIYTAFQPEKQKKINQVIKQHLPEPEIQATAVIIDHHSQSIVAISGGKDYQKFNFHRGFQAFRQPGSAIKSLLVFAPYLAERKIPISTTISAAPFCKNDYCPQNFGGSIYGSVRLETAFKNSYNTASARMFDQISVERAFSYFDKFAFSKIVHEDYRVPAALGGLTFGVSPLEITSSYTIFSNNGKFTNAKGIEKVVDLQGNTLYEWETGAIQVWDKQTNEKMRILLNKVVTEGTGRKAFYSTPYIGGKTGTTNEFHDLWFIGLNDNYTTGVWVGQDQPQSLAGINSRSPHLLIWRDIMK
ncbi:transglycosylase domain-containing protein [Bacillaceae bacterium IKA-2]|nr:transglycosylase domain-containing protein [Bacillaceae bacterium IKA-2]